ncbi:putative site-specific integrase-resolvase [Skermanella aerolata]|uniref:recombinase family protein n=1 Tax=Skermanella aerolata TaxID=393310 RepID=UPI003D198D1B
MPSSLPATAANVAVYVRVSASENKANLDTQADLVASYCAAKGWKIGAVAKEIGYGLNDTGPKLLKLLADPAVSIIVVDTGIA